MVVGVAWAAAACVNTGLDHLGWRQRASATSHAVPELLGLWQVESMTLDGAPVAPSDERLWRDVAIDRGNQLRVRTALGRFYFFEGVEDMEASILRLTPALRTPGDEMTWQFERAVVIRKGFHPAPRRPEDCSTMVDVERDALTLRWRVARSRRRRAHRAQGLQLPSAVSARDRMAALKRVGGAVGVRRKAQHQTHRRCGLDFSGDAHANRDWIGVTDDLRGFCCVRSRGWA
ncbi:MAG: hypothetical protein AAF628_19670 [Planctomycetota bacterium]